MNNFFYFFFVFFLVVEIHAQSYKALFIGNSYTSVNSLPDLVSEMFSSDGDTLSYYMSAPGGCTFEQHCNISLSYIQQGGWDYVILQEQSQLPSFPENQFIQQSYPFAQQLCSIVRQYNPDVHILFYMTWGRKNGDAQNCQYYPPLCTYEGMDSLLYARYMMMASDNQTLVSPVGAAWHKIRDDYPDMELYQSDESHPSYFGSYVAACCFYTMMTHRDPVNIQWNGTLSAAEANIAKETVKKVVYDSLSKWNFENVIIPDDSTGIVNHDNPLSIFPNPANQTLYVRTPDLFKQPTLTIIDMYGHVVANYSEFDSKAINVSMLKNGIYLLSISDGNNHFSKIFTIAR